MWLFLCFWCLLASSKLIPIEGEIRHYAALSPTGGYNYSLLYLANDDAVLLESESVPMLQVPHGSFVTVHGLHRGRDKRASVDGLPVFEVAAIERHELQGNRKRAEFAEQYNDLAISTRRAAIILVDFRDDSVPCGAQHIENMFWGEYPYGSLQKRFEAGSLGQVTFDRDTNVSTQVFGPVTIPVRLGDITECRRSPDIWAYLAENLVKEQYGVEFSNYHHRVFVLPTSSVIQQSVCMWNGLGNIGCAGNCRIWISNCDILGVYEHELGHNLGLMHAASNYALKGDVIGYGDPTGLMGNQWFFSNLRFGFIAPHKYQLGWFPGNKVLEVNKRGRYVLYAHNVVPSMLQTTASTEYVSIRIRRPDNGNHYYHFSFLSGEDSVLPDRCLVHLDKGMHTPTEFIGSLHDSESFVDLTSRFAVTQLHVRNGRMTLDISFGCSFGKTKVSLVSNLDAVTRLHPTETKDVVFLDNDDETTKLEYSSVVILRRSISNFNFTVTIANTDNAICPSTTYNYTVRVNSNSTPRYNVTCAPEDILISPESECTVACRIFTLDDSPLPAGIMELAIASNNSMESANYHDTALKLLLVNQSECIRSPPFISLFHPVIKIAPKSSAVFNFTVINLHTPACGKADFGFYLSLPPFLKTVSQNTTNTLVPLRRFQFDFEAEVARLDIPDEFDVLFTVYDVVRNVTSTHSFRITATREAECYHAPDSPDEFLVSLERNYSEFNARETAKFIATIKNVEFCPKTIYYYLNSTNPSFSISFIPDSQITLGANETRQVFVLVHPPNRVRNESVRLPTEVGVVFHTEKHMQSKRVSLRAEIAGIPCRRNPFAMNPRCDTPLILGPNSDNTIRCRFLIINQDSWPCTHSHVIMNISLNETNYAEILKNKLESKLIETKTFSIDPGNFTYVEVEIKLNETWAKEINETILNLIFSAQSVEFTNLTSIQEVPIQLGRCLRQGLDITLKSPREKTVFIGGDLQWVIETREVVNTYCRDAANHKARLDIGSSDAAKKFLELGNSLTIEKYPVSSSSLTTFHVDMRSSSNMQLNESFALGFVIVFEVEENKIVKNETLQFTILPNCTFHKQNLTAYPTQLEISPGDARRLYISLNMTNNNSALCAPTNFIYVLQNINYAVPGAITSTFILDEYPNNTAIGSFSNYLKSNQTFQFSARISTDYLIRPGKYELRVDVNSDAKHRTHSQSVTIPMVVKCPKPRPVWNFNIQPLYSTFGSSIGNILYWNACIVEAECCCPCRYEIRRNGFLIGFSKHLNFTDQTTLSEIGQSYEYNISVIDNYGERSSYRTCGNCNQIKIQPSPFDFVILLISLPLLMIFPLSVCLFEKWRVSSAWDSDWARYESPRVFFVGGTMYREKPHYGYDSPGESETEESDSGDGVGFRMKKDGGAQRYDPIINNALGDSKDANFSDTEEEMVRRQLSTKIEGSDSSSDASEILKPENGSRMVYFPDEDDTI